MERILEESQEDDILNNLKREHANDLWFLSNQQNVEAQFLSICEHTFQNPIVKLSVLQYYDSIGIRSNHLLVGICLSANHNAQCKCNSVKKKATIGCECSVSEIETWIINTFKLDIDDVIDLCCNSNRMGRDDFRTVIFENMIMDHNVLINIDRGFCGYFENSLILLTTFKNLYVSANMIRRKHIIVCITLVDLMFSRWSPTFLLDGYNSLLRDIAIYGRESDIIPFFVKWSKIPNPHIHKLLRGAIAESNSLCLYRVFKSFVPKEISSISELSSRVIALSRLRPQSDVRSTALIEELQYDILELNINANNNLCGSLFMLPENVTFLLLKFGFDTSHTIGESDLIQSWKVGKHDLQLARSELEHSIETNGICRDIVNICGNYVFIKHQRHQ